jgi:hypothetical protein
MLLPLNEAIALASQRKIIPTSLDTKGIREALTPEMRRRAIFSAQTTNASYLAEMKKQALKLASGEGDMAAARLALKRKLKALGYDPETGFDGDGTGTGAKGSIQDLSSDARLNLILKTLHGTIHGTARRQRETEPERIVLFPAWELVRTEPRDQERTDHEDRFERSGGEVIDGKMIAWKWTDVWRRLGSSDVFDDGLDTEFTPYWFNSGMNQRERSLPVSERYLGKMAILKGGPGDKEFTLPANDFPPLRAPLGDLDPKVLERLVKELGATVDEDGEELTLDSQMRGTLQDLAKANAARVVKIYEEPEFDDD